jgi:hypothetical protein
MLPCTACCLLQSSVGAGARKAHVRKVSESSTATVTWSGGLSLEGCRLLLIKVAPPNLIQVILAGMCLLGASIRSQLDLARTQL